MRVLLVHANPMQRVLPVPAYGLERVASAARARGACVEVVDPFLVSAEPAAYAARAVARFEPDAVGFGLRVLEDCIPIDGPEDAEHAVDVYSVLPEVRELCRAVRASAPEALLVMGGAGFSAAPQECLSYLGLDVGVVGAGEAVFAKVLARHRAGTALAGLAGVVRRGQATPAAYQAAFEPVATDREPLYVPSFGFPVRARIGCAMRCSYCTASTLGRAHAEDDPIAVVDELERVLAHAAGRVAGKVEIFLAADELNLPDERHPIAILREIERRGLHGRITWRSYFNPTPFSDELAELIVATNGHASITVDSAADAVLARNGKPFRRRHLDALVATLERNNVSADIGLIFGLPGETEETLAETEAFLRALPPRIEAVYSAGARVYPHTPLAEAAARQPERVHQGMDAGPLTPAVYSALEAPRALARRLAERLGDLPQVSRMGLGFRRAPRVLTDGYRVVLGDNPAAAWPALLERTEREWPLPFVWALMNIALWHGYAGGAAQAAERLLAHELPPSVDRAELERIAAAPAARTAA